MSIRRFTIIRSGSVVINRPHFSVKFECSDRMCMSGAARPAHRWNFQRDASVASGCVRRCQLADLMVEFWIHFPLVNYTFLLDLTTMPSQAFYISDAFPAGQRSACFEKPKAHLFPLNKFINSASIVVLTCCFKTTFIDLKYRHNSTSIINEAPSLT